MSEFLTWHPSSENAKSLYGIRDQIIDDIYRDPVKAFDALQRNWRFGRVSELWDDFIFENLIRPVLEQNSFDDLPTSVRRYDVIDHLLFTTYIRREENPVRFRRAFWNLNVYGQRLSEATANFFDISTINHSHSDFQFIFDQGQDLDSKKTIKIAFILKGPYKLAHVEFLHSFLQGSAIFASRVKLFLILIDAKKDAPKGLPYVEIFSLSNIKDPFEKIKTYISYCQSNQFDHICWVACVQSLSLYMGMQLAPAQSYWSMKYHSIIMPTLQKYAGLGFGGKSFSFDDVEWFRGRAFPELSMPQFNIDLKRRLLGKHGIPEGAIVIGCFVRAEKLHDQYFWKSVLRILNYSESIHFVIASQYIPSGLLESLNYGDGANRFHALGWVDTKKWAYNLDIYYDSSPRGSCNTVFEAIEAGVPVLLANSSHNRESSSLPYLISSMQAQNLDELPPGVLSKEAERCNTCLRLVDDKSLRSEIANQQQALLRKLKGQKHLFAKDYLNFFLDSNLTLKDTVALK